MVAFMLDDASMEVRTFADDFAALRIKSGVAKVRPARHHAAKARHGKTSLPSVLGIDRKRSQYRIDQLGVGHGNGVRVARIVIHAENDDPQRHADLGRGKSGTIQGAQSGTGCDFKTPTGTIVVTAKGKVRI